MGSPGGGGARPPSLYSHRPGGGVEGGSGGSVTQRHRDGERREERGQRQRQANAQTKRDRKAGARTDEERPGDRKEDTETRAGIGGQGRPGKAARGDTGLPRAPAPPPPCLGRDLRARAEAINGQAAAPGAGGESARASRPPRPCQARPPVPAARGRRPPAPRGAGPRMRSSDLWPAEGRSAPAGSRRGVFESCLCHLVLGAPGRRLLFSVPPLDPTSSGCCEE